MRLTVLSVAYPFARVSEDTAGGAEQVAAALDRGLREAGHESIVIGGDARWIGERELAYERHRREIRRVLSARTVDVVHMHGLDFERYLPEPGVPVIATLHLPPSWYAPEVFRLERPGTRLVCVSQSQRRACPPGAEVDVIENGIAVERLAARVRKRDFVLALGRICPEKGFHLALEAAARAGVPLLLGGEVYPYPEHETYFEREIRPRLRHARYLGPLGWERKRRLMAAARAVLVPSLAPETSSLVAMEALASGTPVIALPNGALPEIVDHGRTGFLVSDVAGMAAAIRRVCGIDPETCRREACERFPAGRMIEQYVETYHRVVNECAAVNC